jgi:hypothetical protein
MKTKQEKTHKEFSNTKLGISGMLLGAVLCIGINAVAVLAGASMMTLIWVLIVFALAVVICAAVLDTKYEKKYGKVNYDDWLEAEVTSLKKDLKDAHKDNSKLQMVIRQFQIATLYIPGEALPISICTVEKSGGNEEHFVVNCGIKEVVELIKNIPLNISYTSIEKNQKVVCRQTLSFGDAEKKILNLIKTRSE